MYNFDGRDLSQQNKPPSEMQQTCGDQSQDKYERFESWLRENGAQFNLVSIVLRTYTLRNTVQGQFLYFETSRIYPAVVKLTIESDFELLFIME